MTHAKNIIEEIWPPLEIAEEGISSRIDAWNRTYRMHGALPERITSGGRDVLASPIRMHATFHGKEEPWTDENVYTVEKTDDVFRYMYQAMTGNIVINARVTAERDGLLWVDLMLIPFCGGGAQTHSPGEVIPKLDSFLMELPLRKDVAALYHYWPVTGPNGLSNSGSVPETGFSLPFKPHLWLGKEEAGLSFYAESDEFWQCASGQNAFELEMTDEAAVLKVHFLDSMPTAWLNFTGDSWGNALEPVSFSFGLQASPVKPYREMGDFIRVCHKELAASPDDLDAFELEADELASIGVKWRTFHEDWSILQNYGLPKDEVLFKAKVDALHKRGMKAMVYFGYEYATASPDFFDDYRTALVRNADGTLRGGWQRFPPQRDYIVCYKGSYAETMRERCRRAVAEYGVDGIYTDGTYEPWACANAEHGCGYTDRRGVRHETFPLRSLREHVKALYREIHELGGIIETHQSSCVIPMITAYCDSYWDGEHIVLKTDPVTGKYYSLSGKELIERYTSESGSGVGTMRAEFTGVNFGIPCQFLANAASYDESSGLTLLYGVLPKPGGNAENLKIASRHWDIMDEYGLTRENFLPFWREDCPVRCEDKRISASAWKTEEGIVAVFVNLSGEPAKTEFTSSVPFEKAVDLQSGLTLEERYVEAPDAAPIYVFLKTR